MQKQYHTIMLLSCYLNNISEMHVIASGLIGLDTSLELGMAHPEFVAEEMY